GEPIESSSAKGWGFYDLDEVDPRAGGSSRAEVDALRLIAMVLHDWDNKAENQRLLCRPGGLSRDGRCTDVLAFLQDVGATFGPTSLDLGAWRSRPLWADPKTCTVNMKGMP